jgi:tRNA-splicing ligase RtcB
MSLSESIIETGPATGILPTPGSTMSPITVIGTKQIRDNFGEKALQQAINSRMAPGVSRLVLNPDAHLGYGAPVGCVLASPTHIYPGPVGVDIKCSMSLLQLNLPASEILSHRTRRALIDAILERTPTGVGNRQVEKSREITAGLAFAAVTTGASAHVLAELGIPTHWARRCEDSAHTGHDGTVGALEDTLNQLIEQGHIRDFHKKARQLGSYGGGNHFGECEIVKVDDTDRARKVAQTFGLIDGNVAFLSHCGSRGLGSLLADRQFKVLQKHFADWSIPLPGNDRELVYAPLGSDEANSYLNHMALGANFATVNHMLINQLVLEAFQEVIPGTQGDLVYFISHNIARKEIIDNRPQWVHRKGATRAYPAGHHELKGTDFYETGHPILLPGNPKDGSAVMVADPGAELSCYSVNHGAGRAMGRRAAARELDQKQVDASLANADVLHNSRQYPLDESPKAYKNFEEVLSSVKQAGLATEVARLTAKFVIKDADKADD